LHVHFKSKEVPHPPAASTKAYEFHTIDESFAEVLLEALVGLEAVSLAAPAALAVLAVPAALAAESLATLATIGMNE
jgi:hypothetical protein